MPLPGAQRGDARRRPLRISIRSEPEDEWAAASIWAAATARRDELASPAPAAAKLQGIRQTLALPGASLHLAWEPAKARGFAVLVPTRTTLEIRYLAVTSDAWGTGIGSSLLTHIREYARANHFATVELWVIDTNARAVDFYERGGWQRTEDLKTQISSRCLERRFVHRVEAQSNRS
jgi:GNAT superfamily N-acetyltransferase